MRYSRRLNYSKRIVLPDLTHMISMTDLMAVGVETLRINIGCSLDKKFIELIHMNPRIVLYLTINLVNLYHNCIHNY